MTEEKIESQVEETVVEETTATEAVAEENVEQLPAKRQRNRK